MALQTVAGHRVGEDADDLKAWLRELSDCPPITHTLAATCHDPAHGGEPSMWFYVEGDAGTGIARRRCVGCATVRTVLDSEQRWTFPPMWACDNCQNSLCEVAFGVHAEPADDGPLVTWLAVVVRCVECGRFDGVTDLVVPRLSLAEVGHQV
jgi:hypothetical protein